VRAQRHDQQRGELRPHDRTASAEGVRGRAGRGGAYDAVGTPLRQRPVVDLEHEIEHPLTGRLLDAGLVQRPGLVQHLAVAAHPDGKGEPLLDAPVALHHPLHGGVEIV
jgi:hypothetical protein